MDESSLCLVHQVRAYFRPVVFPGVGGIAVLTRRMMLYGDLQRQPTSTT